MNFDISAWQEFRVGDLFKLQRGHTLTVEQQEEFEGSIPCVNGTIENNGVQCRLSKTIESIGFSIVKSPAITIVRVGSGGKTFVQTEDFYVADNAFALLPLTDMSVFSMMFVSALLDCEQIKYSYGRTVTNDYCNTIITLPVTFDGNPDWQFMENYIKSLHHKQPTTKNKPGQVPDLNVQDWKEFRVGDLFSIHPTKAIDGVSADDCVGYGNPLIVNSAENNGVAGLCDIEPTEDGNIITFSDTTDGNTFFYQPNPFIGFAHVQGMYPKNHNINKNVMLFISTMLMFDSRGRYSYGRKMRRDTISEIMLKLPVDSDGNPDWQFMENYIKALPYGDRLEG